MTQRPSGWYEDPEDPDQLRYWDGILWSPRQMPKVRPGLDRVASGHPAPVASASPEQDPHRTARGGNQLYPTARQRPTTPDGEVLSGWWQRAGALVIDYLLTSMVGFLVALPWVLDWFRAYSAYFDMLTKWGGSGPMPTVPQDVANPPWQIFVAQIAVYAVYEIAMTVWRGQTVGKIVVGVRVRRVTSSGSPDVAAASTRFLVKSVYLISSLVPGLVVFALMFTLVDYLWPLRDPNHRALHDMAAKTYVVRSRGITKQPLT